MQTVNKTLYIPLYGKAALSRRGILLNDRMAEEIWEQEGFPLRGKAKSKWLAYYMAMRAKTFDSWTAMQMKLHPDAAVLHIGCGMDSRILRLGNPKMEWYDIDFPEVIAQRKRYFSESDHYHMLAGDASRPEWLEDLPSNGCAIVILEGLSMYLKQHQVAALFDALQRKYGKVSILMDVYTTFAAKATKYKNPIHEVGVTQVYGIDDPCQVLQGNSIRFWEEYTMTPAALVEELPVFDRWIFRWIFAGPMTRKIYRLFAYTT